MTKKGFCDRCDHPRPRKLYYDEHIGIWRCGPCTDRMERAFRRDMKRDYENRLWLERGGET
jgi:hypothetical protein